LRLLAKKNPAELIPLVISSDEFFLRVRSIKIYARRPQREIAHEIHPQIEHLRPKIGDLFVTDALLARHISPCNQTLLAWEDQIEIVNFVGVDGTNLWGMTGRFNGSKSDLPWREWPQASQYYDSPVIIKMKAEEIKLERLIENEINKRYEAMLARRASKKP
jgi:hypothetical protein